jgi:glc operon protein GlcG
VRAIDTLDLEDARAAIDAMRAELARVRGAAVLLVADAHGDPILMERLDGAPASSVLIAQNKARTAASERVPSRAIGDRVRSEERLDIAYYGDPRICGWGGGLPVWSPRTVDVADAPGSGARSVIGAVAVSGLPEDEDERIAALGVAAIEARLGRA